MWQRYKVTQRNALLSLFQYVSRFLGFFFLCLCCSLFTRHVYNYIFKSCFNSTDTINLYFLDFIYEHWISQHYNMKLSLSLLVNKAGKAFSLTQKVVEGNFPMQPEEKKSGIYFYISTKNRRMNGGKKNCLDGCCPDSCLFPLRKLIIVLEIMYFSVLTVWRRWRNAGEVSSVNLFPQS